MLVVEPDDESEEPSRYCEGEVLGGRYRLLSILGGGGLGEVWLADHLQLASHVAVKVVRRPVSDHPAEADVGGRFRFEAQVSAMLAPRTQHIVHVHDTGEDARGPFMVMELVAGRTLEDEIAREAPFSAQRVLTVVEQVGEALRCAHDAGIAHRDLKPAGCGSFVAGRNARKHGYLTSRRRGFGIGSGAISPA